MTKTNKKLDNQPAFGQAFIFRSERLEWKEDPKNKLKINDNNRGIQMPCLLHTLSGKEHPELFIHWLRELRARVLEQPIVIPEAKIDCLLHVLKGEAKNKVLRNLRQTDINRIPVGDCTQARVAECFSEKHCSQQN